MRCFAVLLVALIALTIAGCSKDTEQAIEKAAETIATNNAQSAVRMGTLKALQAAAKKAPNATHDAAVQVAAAMPDLQTYFNGQSNYPLASEVSAIIKSKLTAKFDPNLVGMLDGAIELGLSAVAIPPDQKITGTELVIILRVLAGIEDGANQFLDSPPPSVKPVPATTPVAPPPAAPSAPAPLTAPATAPAAKP